MAILKTFFTGVVIITGLVFMFGSNDEVQACTSANWNYPAVGPAPELGFKGYEAGKRPFALEVAIQDGQLIQKQNGKWSVRTGGITDVYGNGERAIWKNSEGYSITAWGCK